MQLRRLRGSASLAITTVATMHPRANMSAQKLPEAGLYQATSASRMVISNQIGAFPVRHGWSQSGLTVALASAYDLAATAAGRPLAGIVTGGT
jgi:hypothetical protein